MKSHKRTSGKDVAPDRGTELEWIVECELVDSQAATRADAIEPEM